MNFSTSQFNMSNNVSHPSEWAPSEWAEADTQMITDDDEGLLSSTSVQAASKVLEQWLSDGQHDSHQRFQDSTLHYQGSYNAVTVTPCDSSASSAEHDDVSKTDLASLMEVDEQIGENLLGDEVFGGVPGEILHLGCSLPMIEESTYNSFAGLDVDLSEEDRRFLAPLLEDTSTTMMDYDAGYVVTDAPSPIMNQERYQEIIKKLEASMKRSQESRKSLYMKTSKMKEYQRKGSVTGVLSSIESSSRQLQTFLKAVQQMKRMTV